MSGRQKFLAEATGTGLLTFAAAGAAVLNIVGGGYLGVVGGALAVGLAATAASSAVYHISGAHLNPAITIAHWVRGKVSTPSGIALVIAQLAGASFAAWIISRIIPDAVNVAHLGTPAVSALLGRKGALVVEALAGAILSWTYFGASDKRASAHGFAISIGAAYAAVYLLTNILTGGLGNPARAFGPAWVSGYWQDQWIFWIGPVVGGLVGSYWHRFTAGPEDIR